MNNAVGSGDPAAFSLYSVYFILLLFDYYRSLCEYMQDDARSIPIRSLEELSSSSFIKALIVYDIMLPRIIEI